MTPEMFVWSIATLIVVFVAGVGATIWFFEYAMEMFEPGQMNENEREEKEGRR